MTAASLNTAEKIRTLGACPVFSGVPASVLAVLAEMMQTERFGAGEALFEIGDPSDRIFIVAAGTLGVFPSGRTQPVRTLQAGEFLGEYGMFTALARTAAVRAQTETVLLSLDYSRFRAFLLQYPAATLVLLKTAVLRLVAAEAGPAGGS